MKSTIEEQVVPEETSLKVERLIALARKNNILRLSAEEGMDVDEAIAVIENYSSLVEESSLPKEHYCKLS